MENQQELNKKNKYSSKNDLYSSENNYKQMKIYNF